MRYSIPSTLEHICRCRGAHPFTCHQGRNDSLGLWRIFAPAILACWALQVTEPITHALYRRLSVGCL